LALPEIRVLEDREKAIHYFPNDASAGVDLGDLYQGPGSAGKMDRKSIAEMAGVAFEVYRPPIPYPTDLFKGLGRGNGDIDGALIVLRTHIGDLYRKAILPPARLFIENGELQLPENFEEIGLSPVLPILPIF
jgi:hypothetical protein